MIRSQDLLKANAEGKSQQSLGEVLNGSSGNPLSAARPVPHLHPDHNLSLALERMGSSGMTVLPVVSRANVRQLVGIVVLEDVLNRYGVVNRRVGQGQDE
jgi:CBS domain-containing protein